MLHLEPASVLFLSGPEFWLPFAAESLLDCFQDHFVWYPISWILQKSPETRPEQPGLGPCAWLDLHPSEAVGLAPSPFLEEAVLAVLLPSAVEEEEANAMSVESILDSTLFFY